MVVKAPTTSYLDRRVPVGQRMTIVNLSRGLGAGGAQVRRVGFGVVVVAGAFGVPVVSFSQVPSATISLDGVVHGFALVGCPWADPRRSVRS